MIVGAVAAFSNVESRVEDLISEEELLNIRTPEDVHNKIVEMMQMDNDNTEFLTSRRDALIQELNEIDNALSLAGNTTAPHNVSASALNATTAIAGCKAHSANATLEKACFTSLKTAADAAAALTGATKATKDYAAAIDSAYDDLYGSSSLFIWIVVAILVVAAGVGVFFFLKKKGDSNEGGASDGYTKFIDQELA